MALLALSQSAFAAKVLDIDIIGNKNIARDVILNQIQSLKVGREFASEDAIADRERVEQMGLFQEVSYETKESADGIVVVFRIVENPVVASITVEGNQHVPTSELVKGLETKVGSVVNLISVEKDTDRIIKVYREKGYLADIGDVTDKGGDVVITVVELKVHMIELKGLKRTRQETVMRYLTIKPKDLYDLNKLRRDINRLRDLDIFEEVGFDPIVNENNPPGTANVQLTVKERHNVNNLLFGIASTFRNEFVGYLSLSTNNFRGKAEQVALRTEVGDRQTYELSYTNPFFDQKRTSFHVSGGDRRFFREPRGFLGTVVAANNVSDFEERRKGGTISFSRPRDEREETYVAIGYRYDDVSFIQRSGVVAGQVIATSFGAVSAPSISMIRDTRDSRLDPNKGFRGSVGMEIATGWLGSDSSFQKLDFDIRRYLGFGKKIDEDNYRDVVAGRLMFGKIFGFPPVFEQYFMGGAESVRGYDIDQLYGENQLIANMELRHRIQKNFTAVLFLDFGSAWSGPNSNTQQFKSLVGKGFGMRIRTPFGPLRLDYGIGDRTRFHFSVGQAF